jgi:hypothetical protein
MLTTLCKWQIKLLKIITNPAPIPRKLTRIAGQYFLYHKSAQSQVLSIQNIPGKSLTVNCSENQYFMGV